MIKNYLIDTNLLLSNPETIFGFEENNVYLCGTVLQELEKFKNESSTERGFNARESIRIIKNLIKDACEDKTKEEKQKTLAAGLDLPGGGKLFFEADGVSVDNLPKGYSLDNPDNRIISSCVHMNKNYLRDNNITLLTNDGACYVNSLLCGVDSDTVRNEMVKDTSYTGHLDLEIEDWKVIDTLYETGTYDLSKIKEITELDYPLLANQFVTITSGTKSVLTVFYRGVLQMIDHNSLHNGIKPLNKMQSYALWALLNPDISLVILEGPAGTSKTFLSLAAGLEELDVGEHKDNENYKTLLLSRPNTNSADQDFGALPGDLEEKMSPLLASYTDNLKQIISFRHSNDMTQREINDQVADYFEAGFIEVCPLYVIGGRSITNAFLICDEAQNSSKNLIRHVVTRAGKNCKIVVAGDPRQVDAPHLDKKNNGLVYLKDSMKGSANCAILKFDTINCVRSDLAEDAISRMK